MGRSAAGRVLAFLSVRRGRSQAAAGLAVILIAAGAPADRAAPLLQALKAAPDPSAAHAIEVEIVAYWHAQTTPSVQLLLQHAQQSIVRQDRVAALKDLDAALDLQPEVADLWRLHAEARFANGDDAGASADIAQALSREPRCFTALSDLSHFAESRGDYPRALAAWRKLLDIDPKAPDADKRLDALKRKVEGEPL